MDNNIEKWANNIQKLISEMKNGTIKAGKVEGKPQKSKYFPKLSKTDQEAQDEAVYLEYLKTQTVNKENARNITRRALQDLFKNFMQ